VAPGPLAPPKAEASERARSACPGPAEPLTTSTWRS